MQNIYDIVFINPPAYSGVSKRGPYELSSLNEIALDKNFTSTVIDIQEYVGNGDFQFPNLFKKSITELLDSVKARIFFITLRTTGAPWALEIAYTIKKMYSSSIIVFYAPRIEALIRRSMSHYSCIDILCRTRAEEIIIPLLKATISMNRISALYEIPNIYFRDGENILESRKTKFKIDLDTLPNEKPWYSPDGTLAAILIGRGCPHSCVFCSVGKSASRDLRFHSAQHIVSESQRAWKKLKEHKLSLVMLENESFLSNKVLFQEFVDEYTSQNAEFSWGAYGRIDDITSPNIQLFEKTNCKFLFIGIESGSQKIQQFIDKNLNVKEILPIIKKLISKNIIVHCTFIYGFPGEKLDDIFETLDIMIKISLAGGVIDINPLRIEPETYIEHLSLSTGTQLLTNSQLYLDLKEAGYNPEMYDSSIAYRMYTIHHKEYNINELSIRVDTLQYLMNTTPLTIHLILDFLKLPLSAFLESLRNYNNTINFVKPSVSKIWENICLMLSNTNDKLQFFILQMLFFELNQIEEFHVEEKEYLKYNSNEINKFYPIVKANIDLIPTLFINLAKVEVRNGTMNEK